MRGQDVGSSITEINPIHSLIPSLPVYDVSIKLGVINPYYYSYRIHTHLLTPIIVMSSDIVTCHTTLHYNHCNIYVCECIHTSAAVESTAAVSFIAK